jgi:MFS family permease
MSVPTRHGSTGVASSLPPAGGPSRRYAAYALALLALLNLLSYVNRNVIFALVPPIELDLSLSDTDIGWIASAFVLLFSVAVFPFGVLSDLRSRRAVAGLGVVLWSAFAFLAGFSRGFGSLFLTRAAVGIGAAAFTAAAASLVADYYPGRRRALAMGIFSAGIPIGGVLGIALGGQLEALYDWRIAMMGVAVPGLALAGLVFRLTDPSRPPPSHTVREYWRQLELGVTGALRVSWPLLSFAAAGGLAAWVLDRRYGAGSSLDIAALATGVGLGLAGNLWLVVRRLRRSDGSFDFSPGTSVNSALTEMHLAVDTVLRTPTLKYIFVGGALVSFGVNGLVGWAPTFMARTLELSVAQGTLLLGKWGLLAGTAGTLAGGIIADWLGRFTGRGRMLVSAGGLVIGGPLTAWLLGVRDLGLFVPVFLAAFFFLTLYNGPIVAAVFDVAPARIGATVVGAYLLFIHVAGDAIALPLVGFLSDRFGIDRAIFILPAAALLGGVVLFLGVRTVERDVAYVTMRTTASHPVVAAGR